MGVFFLGKALQHVKPSSQIALTTKTFGSVVVH